MSYNLRSIIPIAVGLLAAVAPLEGAVAQNASGRNPPPFPEYRLTPEMVRKVSGIMKQWNPTPGLGAVISGGDIGMPKAKFDALPENEKERILVANMERNRSKQKEGERLVLQLTSGTMASRLATADRIPELKVALGPSGLAMNEFLQALHAYNAATVRILIEEEAPESIQPLPAGVRKDNVATIRPMTTSEKLWTVMGVTKGR